MVIGFSLGILFPRKVEIHFGGSQKETDSMDTNLLNSISGTKNETCLFSSKKCVKVILIFLRSSQFFDLSLEMERVKVLVFYKKIST